MAVCGRLVLLAAAGEAAVSLTTGSRSSTSPYSLSLTTFDPSGRLEQLEFAMRSVDRGPAAAAMVCGDGVVVAKWSTGSVPSIHVCRVTETIAVTYAGSEADFGFLRRKCAQAAVDHARLYGTEIGVAGLADDLSSLVQEYTQTAGLRPLGCAVLIAGVDDDGRSELFVVDPSGWVAPWRATAVGNHAAQLQETLAKHMHRLSTVDDARTFIETDLDAVAVAGYRRPDDDDDRVVHRTVVLITADQGIVVSS
mmetsp:Transcript_11402/g.28969  ORF Transcript_11402/g.28969 Transcript_11402/m.28969 type:complete len:252 (-) Transcript_11402:261-1016(-)